MESSFIQLFLYSYINASLLYSSKPLWTARMIICDSSICKIVYNSSLPDDPSLVVILSSPTITHPALSLSYLLFLYPFDFPLCAAYATHSQRCLFLPTPSFWGSVIFVPQQDTAGWGSGWTIKPWCRGRESPHTGRGQWEKHYGQVSEWIWFPVKGNVQVVIMWGHYNHHFPKVPTYILVHVITNVLTFLSDYFFKYLQTLYINACERQSTNNNSSYSKKP